MARCAEKRDQIIRNKMVVGNVVSNTSHESAEKGLSVLVVDDDPVIQKIHKMMLTNKFKISDTQVAVNGKQAVDLHHCGAIFDLILMDMEMPVMNGIQATMELRAMGVESMIVGVTSHGLDAEKQTFIGAGLDDCFAKPLAIQTISSLLQLIGN